MVRGHGSHPDGTAQTGRNPGKPCALTDGPCLRYHTGVAGASMERSNYREYVERFAAKLSAEGKARNTVACYTRDVGEFLTFLGETGPERIDALTEEQVARFVGGLRSRELGERSKAKKLTSIRAFLSWAQAERILDAYPPKLTFARVRGVLAGLLAVEQVAAQVPVPQPAPKIAALG